MTARRQNGIPGARAVRYVAVVLLVGAGCSGDDAPADHDSSAGHHPAGGGVHDFDAFPVCGGND